MNNKFLTLIMALCFVSAALAGCTSNEEEEETTTTVKIGFLNPQTGPLENDAPGFSWGVSEAIKDLNAGSDNVNFEVVEVNSGCDGTVGATGAQTLVDSGVVGVVGAACSGASMAANAVLSAAGIPMISYASTNPSLSSDEDYPHFYRIVPSDAIQGPAAAAMIKDAGATNLSIMHMTNDYGSGLADALEAAWDADNDMCSAGKIGYAEDATDFAANAQTITDAGCSAVFLSSYITDAALIIEALGDAGYGGMIFSGDGPAGVGLYEGYAGADAELAGVMVTAPRSGTTYGDFDARYDANAAEVGSIKQYVLTAYDATMIIGKASQSGDDIVAGIESVGTNYQGASGLINFLDNGDVGGAGYDICTYTGHTDDEDGGFACTKYWTAENGVQGEDFEIVTIKIGFLNPLTGPLENDAPGFSWGVSEAINDLNAWYTGVVFEAVEVNSGCDGTVGATGAQTLVDSGVVAVVGAACSGASMGANAVLSAAGIPMISYASTNPTLSSDADYPHFYRIVPSDAYQGPAAAAMMADAGASNLAILHMTNDYGSGLADAVESAWDDGTNMCSSGKIGYAEDATDFASTAQEIVNAGCGAVFLSSYITDAALIIEALGDAGYTGMIFSGDGPAGVGLYEGYAGDNADLAGVMVTAPRAGDTTYGDFAARYDANAADVGSIKQYVLTAYDATMIIGKASQAGGTIVEGIESVGTNFEGASGLISFLDNGDIPATAGYDICSYSGDTSDANGGFSCGKYYTDAGGVQDASA